MTMDFQAFAENHVVIMSAPNGARRSQLDHPALPITPAELALNAVALRDAGVSILHLHVRDEYGKHSLDAERYRQAIAAIRDRIGEELVIQVTTEAVGQYTPEEQTALVRDLRPEAVSVALREICATPADETRAAEFFAWMRQEQIWPQYILYSVEDVERFDDMRRRGVFADDSPFVMFVLGDYVDAVPGVVEDLDALLAATDPNAHPWAVCCFGHNENAVMLAATARNGHVRMGFENNLVLPDGDVAADNAALIHEYTATSAGSGRRPASAAEVRATLMFVAETEL